MDPYTSPVVRVRRPRASLWTLRIVITAFVLAVLAQPVLAGLYLTGDVDSIAVHGVVGSLLALGALVVVGATLAYVLGGHGPIWVLPVSVLLLLAVGFEIAAGYARQLELHLPLGVAIVTTSLLLTFWVWSPSATRARGTR